mmetsp:Transcript_22380/g.66319  ORF Transcript_22380/g.66319 Transcript_22380/m.66319 type:complete len:208 (+) Transcript_22380:248-871(+)
MGLLPAGAARLHGQPVGLRVHRAVLLPREQPAARHAAVPLGLDLVAALLRAHHPGARHHLAGAAVVLRTPSQVGSLDGDLRGGRPLPGLRGHVRVRRRRRPDLPQPRLQVREHSRGPARRHLLRSQRDADHGDDEPAVPRLLHRGLLRPRPLGAPAYRLRLQDRLRRHPAPQVQDGAAARAAGRRLREGVRSREACAMYFIEAAFGD